MKKIIATDKNHLIHLIKKQINKTNLECDLNYIDVSQIKDMSEVFSYSNFNGDISEWDVSNVTDMESMFVNSKFDGDISRWNTKNVTNMYGMFRRSNFNQDISQWNVSNVEDMKCMFFGSSLKICNIKDWELKLNPTVITKDMFFAKSLEIPEWFSNNEESTQMNLKSIQDAHKLNNVFNQKNNKIKIKI